MKSSDTVGRVAAAWCLLVLPMMAQGPLDPLADPLANAAPIHEIIEVRVTMQAVVVPLTALTGWLGGPLLSDAELHAKALAVAATPAGRIMDTQMLVAQSKTKATLEGGKEMIYPTEYDLPTLTVEALAELQQSGFQPSDAGPRTARPQEMFIAWETRIVGELLEFSPLINPEGTQVKLLLGAEWVELLGLEKWLTFRDAWGGGAVQRPTFFARRFNTSLTLKPGSFHLVSMHAPSPRDTAAQAEKVLVFLRAEILSSPMP